MHELSVAAALVAAAEDALRAQRGSADASVVATVEVRIGQLSGVVPTALTFAYDVAVDGTLLAGSRLVVHEVAPRIWCPCCEVEADTTGAWTFSCVTCGTASPDLRAGREIELTRLTLAEPAVTP